jgi:hypothetical protein
MEVSGQLQVLAAFVPRTYGIGCWGGPQGDCGKSVEERNVLPLSEMKPQFLGHPACSLAAVVISLSQLLERGFYFIYCIYSNQT